MPKHRSVSVKKKNQSESPSSQDSSRIVGEQTTSVHKSRKTKPSREISQSKESILTHFEKRVTTMASNNEDVTDGKLTADTDPEAVERCDGEEEEEPSNKDLMKMLRFMTDTFNRKLDQLGDTVDILKGEVFTLQQENDKLKSELTECKKKEEVMERKLNEAAFQAKLADERSDRNEQYSRRNNIKLLYVAEKTDGLESAEESEAKALRVFHDKLGLRHIKPDHIEAAHRVGKKREGQSRPIIVKFISRKTKKEIIQNRKELKNSTPKIVIVEDLTKRIYTLYRLAADHPSTMRCWTTDGKIIAKDMDSKIHRIDTTADLQKLSIDVSPPSSSAPTRRQQFQRHRRWADVLSSPPSSSGTLRGPRNIEGTAGNVQPVNV